MGSLNPDADSKQGLDDNDSGYVQDDTTPKQPVEHKEEEYRGMAELLDLSDDVLLYILRECAPEDLKALGFTCPRLGALVLDRSLWVDVSCRAACGRRRMRWYLSRALGPHTRRLRLLGYAPVAEGCLGFVNRYDVQEADDSAVDPDEERYLCADRRVFRLAHSILRYSSGHPYWPSPPPANATAPGPAPPNAAPNATPNATPNAAPNATPNAAPNATPNAAPNATPNAAPNATPNAAPNATPNAYPVSCPGPQLTLTHTGLRALSETCCSLRTLELENCVIDCQTTNIGMFPKTLTKLSLRGTKCFNLESKSFLFKIQDHLKHLEELDVSHCSWIEPACMLPLSKMPCLRVLGMQECHKLAEFVAYASLACRYGFKKLKVLDLRGSPVGDSEVSSLGWLPNLEELYLSPSHFPSRAKEHAHYSHDLVPKHTELEEWEETEPDYFKPPTISEEEWLRDEENVHGNRTHYYAACRDESTSKCILLERMIAEPVSPEEYAQVFQQFLGVHNNAAAAAHPDHYRCILLERMIAEPVSPEEYAQVFQQFLGVHNNAAAAAHPDHYRDAYRHYLEPAGYSLFIRRTNGDRRRDQPGPSRRQDEPGPSGAGGPARAEEPGPSGAVGPVRAEEPGLLGAGGPSRPEEPGPSGAVGPVRAEEPGPSGRNGPSKADDTGPSRAEGPLKAEQAGGPSNVNGPSKAEEPGLSNINGPLKADEPPSGAKNPLKADNAERSGVDGPLKVDKPGSSGVVAPSTADNTEPSGVKGTIKMDVVDLNKIESSGGDEAGPSVSDVAGSLDVEGLSKVVTEPSGTVGPLKMDVADSNLNEIAPGAEEMGPSMSDVARASSVGGPLKAEEPVTLKMDVEEPSEPSGAHEAGPLKTDEKVPSKVDEEMPGTSTGDEARKRQADEPGSSGTNFHPKNDSSDDSSDDDRPPTKRPKEKFSPNEKDDSAKKDPSAKNEDSTMTDDSLNDDSLNDDSLNEDSPKKDDSSKEDAKKPESMSEEKKRRLIEARRRMMMEHIRVLRGRRHSRRVLEITINQINARVQELDNIEERNYNEAHGIHIEPDEPNPANNDHNAANYVPNAANNIPNLANNQPNPANYEPNPANNEPMPANNEPNAANNAPNAANALHAAHIDPNQFLQYLNVHNHRRFQFCGYRRPIVIEELINGGEEPRGLQRLPRGLLFSGGGGGLQRLDHSSLVTDSSVRRFGRAIGENINYIHIGGGERDVNARPDRSSLRILSIAGFGRITDASLTHLATAAPDLRRLDVSNTGVTHTAVERFRAMRPEVEVTATATEPDPDPEPNHQ